MLLVYIVSVSFPVLAALSAPHGTLSQGKGKQGQGKSHRVSIYIKVGEKNLNRSLGEGLERLHLFSKYPFLLLLGDLASQEYFLVSMAF